MGISQKGNERDDKTPNDAKGKTELESGNDEKSADVTCKFEILWKPQAERNEESNPSAAQAAAGTGE